MPDVGREIKLGERQFGAGVIFTCPFDFQHPSASVLRYEPAWRSVFIMAVDRIEDNGKYCKRVEKIRQEF